MRCFYKVVKKYLYRAILFQTLIIKLVAFELIIWEICDFLSYKNSKQKIKLFFQKHVMKKTIFLIDSNFLS